MKQIIFILVLLISPSIFSQTTYGNIQTGQCYIMQEEIYYSYDRRGNIDGVHKKVNKVFVKCPVPQRTQTRTSTYDGRRALTGDSGYREFQDMTSYPSVPTYDYQQQRNNAAVTTLTVIAGFTLLDRFFNGNRYSYGGINNGFFLFNGFVGGNPYQCGIPIHSTGANPLRAASDFGGGPFRGLSYFTDWNDRGWGRNWNYDPRLYHDLNQGVYFRR